MQPPPPTTTTSRLNHRHQPSTTSTTSSTSSSSSSTRPALQHILTNSPSNAVHLSRSTARTSRRVRSHWFSHFALNWRRSSRTSKLFLASSMTLMAVQVIASIIVLTFSWEMYCDKPLRVFITVYILRLTLACPLTVYLHLIPRRLLQQQQRQSQQQPSSSPFQSSHYTFQQPTVSAENRAETGEMYPMTNITTSTTMNMPNTTLSSALPSTSSSSNHPTTTNTAITTGIVPSAAQPPLPPTTPASFISSAHQEPTPSHSSYHHHYSSYHSYHHPYQSHSSHYSPHHQHPEQQPSVMAQAPPPNIMHRTSRPEISNPLYPDTTLTHWIDRAKSALDMFGLLWFIIGNYMLFTSSTCSETAVPLYYLSLVVIIYNYMIISVPIFLCTAVIFCLPCVLVGMRIIHVEDAVDMGGASSEEIASIPIYQFKSNKPIPPTPTPLPTTNPTSTTRPISSAGHEEIEIHELNTSATTAAAAATTTVPTTTSKKQSKKMSESMEPSLSFLDHIWVRLGFISDSSINELSSSSSYQEFDTIEIPNEQDQVCAICLSTYDDGDILCQLWCNHHFHRTCVHEWLALNSRCPMCKRDCRGKPYPEENHR
ncbi:hypothetical protein BDA99DRAFT_491421 [Phascolomyces articulosus]|uniref:RING-type domain-containing protein n=1 Tax=Phascolomyces articulosus TaxID=60185 RepID=A0AAD5PK85_9FUNG|nr:hypothetical protein BDA99DRAFT_491421 [Phascolomyces articulosus]